MDVTKEPPMHLKKATLFLQPSGSQEL